MEKFNRNEKDLKQKKGGFADKVGEAVEHAGDRIADAGMPSIGKKIHDAGDRLEKTHDKSQGSSINKTQKDY